MDLYALDFDGVLCDTCGEGALSALTVFLNYNFLPQKFWFSYCHLLWFFCWVAIVIVMQLSLSNHTAIIYARVVLPTSSFGFISTFVLCRIWIDSHTDVFGACVFSVIGFTWLLWLFRQLKQDGQVYSWTWMRNWRIGLLIRCTQLLFLPFFFMKDWCLIEPLSRWLMIWKFSISSLCMILSSRARSLEDIGMLALPD